MHKIKRFVSKHKKIFRDYMTVVSGISLGRGLSFITSLILARKLGIDGFGVFSVFFTVLFLTWQFPTIMDSVYVRFAKVESEEKRREYLRTAFVIKCAIFFLLLIIAYPLSRFMSVYVFRKPELLSYLLQAFMAGAFLSVYTSVTGIYLAKENFTIYSIMNLIFYVMVFAAVLVAVFFRLVSPLVCAYIFSISAAVVGCWGMSYVYQRVKPIFPIRISLFRDMLHFGKWLIAYSVTFLILQRLDVLFLTRFTGYNELGIYSAAVRFGMLATILTSAASAIFMPRGCESCKSGKNMRSYLKETSVAMVAFTLIICLLMMLAPVMTKLFFGQQYMSSILATRILLLEALFTFLYMPFSFIFYSSGNTKLIFSLGIVKLGVAITCLSLFIPVLGAVGAAISIAVSSGIGLVVAVFMGAKIIKHTQMSYGLNQEILEKAVLD